jgi:hypothetical protein
VEEENLGDAGVCVSALSFLFFYFRSFAVHFNHTLDSDLLEDTDICLSWKL